MAILEPQIAHSSADRAWEIYFRLRSQIETADKIGKLILLDLNSGDYEIANDELGFAASAFLRERHPDAKAFALRIGYEAVDVIGGVLERLETP